MNFIKDKRVRTIALLAFLAVIALFLKIIIGKEAPPTIIKTSPENGEQNVSLSSKIALFFDKEGLRTEDWQITIQPSFNFSLKTNTNILEAENKEPLQEQTKYNIEIKNRRFKNFYYFFSFTTTPKAETLVGGRGDPDFYEEIQKEIAVTYPLLRYMPYKTSSWSIHYLKPLKLIVYLKRDTPETRKEVLDWISSKGVDPVTHTIEWKIKSNF